MDKHKSVCEACGNPADYSVEVTNLKSGAHHTVVVCSEHLEDPGPLLPVK